MDKRNGRPSGKSRPKITDKQSNYNIANDENHQSVAERHGCPGYAEANLIEMLTDTELTPVDRLVMLVVRSLKHGCKLPVRKIAARVGVSANTVEASIRKLLGETYKVGKRPGIPLSRPRLHQVPHGNGSRTLYAYSVSEIYDEETLKMTRSDLFARLDGSEVDRGV